MPFPIPRSFNLNANHANCPHSRHSAHSQTSYHTDQLFFLLLSPHNHVSRHVAHSRALILLRLLSLLPLLLLQQSLSELLPRHDPLVLGLDLLPILRQLVAFLGLRPKIVDSKSIVQVRSEVVHDADGEQQIGAELILGKKGKATSQQRRLPSLLEADGGIRAYLEDFEIDATHLEFGIVAIMSSRNWLGQCVALECGCLDDEKFDLDAFTS